MVWAVKFKQMKLCHEPEELFSMSEESETDITSLHHKRMLKTGVTRCNSAQCDRLQNTSMLSTIWWKCDFFVAMFHHRTLLNVTPLILHKSQDQFSLRLVLIRQQQTLITSLFSVIILWHQSGTSFCDELGDCWNLGK